MKCDVCTANIGHGFDCVWPIYYRKYTLCNGCAKRILDYPDPDRFIKEELHKYAIKK